MLRQLSRLTCRQLDCLGIDNTVLLNNVQNKPQQHAGVCLAVVVLSFVTSLDYWLDRLRLKLQQHDHQLHQLFFRLAQARI